MLQLFGSGLISLWLDMAGVHAKPQDALEFVALHSSPGFVLATEPNPTEVTVQQYLKGLVAKGLVGASQGIWIQSGPMLLANHQGTVPLPAASLTKIATSLAALNAWGPNHQFETLISTTGPVNKGVLRGDLVIRGHGDPLFLWEDAIALSQSLNRLGIRRVTGKLVIDGNFAMNYQSDPVLAGQLLKQGLDSKLWPRAATLQYWLMPKGTPRPSVEIAGAVTRSGAGTLLLVPKQILLVRHHSLPLSHILKEMNVYSNNEMAEMLAQSLGGAQAVQSLAAKAAGVPQSEIQLINGSGLGVENRISPRAVCAMLLAIQRRALPHQMSVADFFPIAGHDRRGTMYARHIPTDTAIKTGTLRDVSALAGVMPTRDRGLVWFAIINRGNDLYGFRTGQDQLLQRLLQQLRVPAIPSTLNAHPFNTAPTHPDAGSRNEVFSRS